MAKRGKRRYRRHSIGERIADLEALIAKLRVVGKGRERFSPEAVRKDRKRLELTLVEYADLAGLSKNTVHSWEHHRKRPPASQLEQWLAVKRMSKAAAWKNLGIKGRPKSARIAPRFPGKAVLAERKTRRALRTTDERIVVLETRLARARAVARYGRKFSPDAVKKERARLGLTAAEYGQLAGVTADAIYCWESGRSVPGPEQIEKWLAIKGMSREAAWKKVGIEEAPEFNGKAVRAERKRLGLSAAKYGELVGVSMRIIYKWEKCQSVPRQGTLEKWLSVRGMPKRAAWMRLGIEGVSEFSGKAVLAERRRLALSVAKYADLVGVSKPTVYNWEVGKYVPREKALEKWLAVKGIGKAKAEKQLGLG